MAPPVVAGLDEEVARSEEKSVGERREEVDSEGMAEQLRSTLSLQHDDSSAASPSSSLGTGEVPWANQNEWLKHESFVHRLERLLDDEDEEEDEEGEEELGDISAEYDDDEEEAQLNNEDAQQRARRRKRKLLKLRRRYARRRSQPTGDLSLLEEEDSNAAVPSIMLARASSRSSRSRGGEGPQGIQMRSASLSGSLNPSPAIPSRTSSSTATATTTDGEDGGDDDFYDAVAGPSPAATYNSQFPPSTRRSEDDSGQADTEGSWLNMLPRPNATASSATLRQDALERTSSKDLHHQASTATLLGMGEGDNHGRRRSSILPPARPSPTSPLPPTPQPPTSLSATVSPRSTSPSHLGPSGTIRSGRPRGATVGAVPGARGDVRPRIRPRSLLSNEMSLDQDDGPTMTVSTSQARPSTHTSMDANASLPSPSVSSESSALHTSSVLPSNVTEGLRSAMLNSTPSSSAASIASSSALGSSKASFVAESRSRSGSGTGLLQHIQSRPRSHASFVISVVGHKGAGKSTVIRKGLRQFGLSRPTVLSDRITSHSTVCIVDQEQRTIEVLEMDASVLLNGPSKRFAWPKSLPYIDAAILCYDASQISSFRGMSELLENFAMNHLSTVMLACKSELSPKAVDPYYASDMASVYNVGLAECSVQSEEGKKRMRDCFSYLVKEVAKGRASMRTVESSGLATGIMSPFTATTPNADRTITQEILVGSRDNLTDSVAAAEAGLSSAAGATSASRSPQDVRSLRGRSNRKLSDVTIGSVDAGSEEDSTLQQSINRAQLGLQSAKSVGGYVSIEELWDKLFFAAVSGNDERFLHMFMTFYRGFARPIELLRQIVARFDALARGEKADGVMIRYSLMKLTTMLGDWMQEFPGDLSGAETFALLTEFFDRLLHHPATMHVAAPMQPLLDVVRAAPDLDAAWSKNQDSDKPRSVAADVPPVKPRETRDRASSTSSSSAVPTGNGLTIDLSDAGSSSHGSLMPSATDGRPRSASDVTTTSSEGQRSANLPGTPGGSSSASGPFPPHSAQAQRAALRNVANMLFDVRDEDIAQELTRIEWDIFCTIGPRDLLRHILVSRTSRAPDSPVARNIAHFNYTSAWVCSLVLSQSKSKQRARMLEKFMEVATILRKTNNYNTLHAILAGLGNASIHRLKHTRELLNGKPVMKQYQSLTRLMGSERSFAAYRLALENSESRTIPYLGVHLQDILSTSDGNPSKRSNDGMVHWRKFSLMYDAVMAIVRCQQYQMPLRENPVLSQMILDLPVMDEDALYQRSLQVEPRQSSNTAGSAGSRIIKQIFHA